MLSKTLRLNFCYLKVIHIVHPHYHGNMMGYILRNNQKEKCVCIHEIKRLIIMKMKIRMETRSHRYDINRHGHKFSKYKKCLSMIVLIYIK